MRSEPRAEMADTSSGLQMWTQEGSYRVATVVDVDSGLWRGGGGESATWRRYSKPQVWMSWRSDCRSRKGDGCELGSAPRSPDPEK